MRGNRMKNRKTSRKEILFLLAAVTAVFAVLYWEFITGKYLYAYQKNDIGSDTVTTYLPQLQYELRSLREHVGAEYSMTWGLGKYVNNFYLKYLNPVNWPILILGESNLGAALLLSMYMKYILIGIFGFLFFRRILQDPKIAAICALIWTYNGFSVLWGQHYQNLTNMVLFTMTMYVLQLFLENDKKRILLIPVLAAFLITSYFCFYMSCYLIAGYSIAYLAFQRAGVKEILKKAAAFAGSVIVAACIAGISLQESVSSFLRSARVSDDVASSLSSRSGIYSPEYLLTFLNRIFSNDLLGTGNDYSGPINYYEAAILSVSALFLFLFVLLLFSKWKMRTLLITFLCSVMLALVPVSNLLGFSSTYQRWTFIYCFLEVILIGYGLKELAVRRKQVDFPILMKKVIGITIGIYLGVVILTAASQTVVSVRLSVPIVILLAAVLCVYSLFFLRLSERKIRHPQLLFAFLVMAELVAVNYASVNNRVRVSTEDWNTSMYNDGTEIAVNRIAEQEDSLYRINKTYDSVAENDAMVQDYAGVSIYSSTNSGSLVELYRNLGSAAHGNKSNWIRFQGTEDCINALLSVKYLITDIDDKVNNFLYSEVETDDTHRVYQNIHASTFGYFYRNSISESAFKKLDTLNRRFSLLQAYYVTGGSEDEEENSDAIETITPQTLNLADYQEASANVEAERTEDGIRLIGAGDDMQVCFNLGEMFYNTKVLSLSFTAELEKAASLQIFYAAEGEQYTDENSTFVVLEAGANEVTFDLSDKPGITKLRIDPSTFAQTVELKNLQVAYLENYDLLIAQNVERLYSHGDVELTQSGNHFYGSVTNYGAEDAMLCLPLIYDAKWTASVDGVETDVVNINGGLIGLNIGGGSHEILLTYRTGIRRAGYAFSFAGGILYLLVILFRVRKGQRGQRKARR